MKKNVYLIILTTIILLLVCLSFFLFMHNDSKKAETVAETPMNTAGTENNLVEKRGNFIRIDPLHFGSGEVTVEKIGDNYKLKFLSNFSSTKGPDVHVYLSSMQNFKNIALGGVDTSKTLDLGPIKSEKGVQEYLVSKKDFEKYNFAVILWCQSFNVQFSRADLNTYK